MGTGGKNKGSRVGLGVVLVTVGLAMVVAGQVLWAGHEKSCPSGSESCPAGERKEKKTGDTGKAGRPGEVAEARTAGAAASAGGYGKEARTSARPSGRGSAIRVTPLAPGELTLILKKRKHKLTADHKRQLSPLIQGRTDGKWTFVVTGYAAERSSKRKNRKLARRRASSAAATLRKMGVPKSSIEVKASVPGRKKRRKGIWRKVSVVARPGDDNP